MDLPNVPWTDWLHFPLPEPEPANKDVKRCKVSTKCSPIQFSPPLADQTKYFYVKSSARYTTEKQWVLLNLELGETKLSLSSLFALFEMWMVSNN